MYLTDTLDFPAQYRIPDGRRHPGPRPSGLLVRQPAAAGDRSTPTSIWRGAREAVGPVRHRRQRLRRDRQHVLGQRDDRRSRRALPRRSARLREHAGHRRSHEHDRLHDEPPVQRAHRSVQHGRVLAPTGASRSSRTRAPRATTGSPAGSPTRAATGSATAGRACAPAARRAIS